MPGMKPVDKASNPGLAKLPQEVRNKMGYMAKGGAVKAKEFKPCAGCPSPAKCKKAGKCLMKGTGKAKGGVAGKGPSVMIAIAIPKAKKGKK